MIFHIPGRHTLTFVPPPSDWEGPASKKARVCPECRDVPARVRWSWFSSDPQSWACLGGRAGWEGFCAEHGVLVETHYTMVS